MTIPHRKTPDDWIDEDGSVFPSDLWGYAAVDAAIYLHDHWQECSPPLTLAERLSDIDGTIAVLQRWRAQQAKGGPR